MSAKGHTDYSDLKALFFTGLNLKEIADNAGISYMALRQHAHRNQWYKKRDEAKVMASQAVTNRLKPSLNSIQTPTLDPMTIVTNLVAQRREQYLNNVSKGVAKASDLYAQANSDTLEQAGMNAKLMEPVHNLAKTTFGLDAKPDTALQVNIMSNLTDNVRVE